MRNILLSTLAAATICVGVHQEALAGGVSYLLTVNPTAKIIATSPNVPPCARVNDSPAQAAAKVSKLYAHDDSVHVVDSTTIDHGIGTALHLDNGVAQVFMSRVVDCHSALQLMLSNGYSVVDPSGDPAAPAAD